MFGFIADGLTVAITVLLPVFASYKALHTSDPAQLAPWLIYFVTLILFHTVENTFDFVLAWLPFWSWIRLSAHLYLILPGFQGATFLYTQYIDPFLDHHEREIDDFITQTHDNARKAGLAYLQQTIEWVKVKVLGLPPQRPPPSPLAGQTYAQNLMSRFNMPAARGSDNLYSLVNQALSGATALYSGNSEAQAAELSRNANIIPQNIRSSDDRLGYVSSQRERLMALVQAFDREAENMRAQREGGIRHPEGKDGLSRSRSDADFDIMDADEISSASDRPPYPLTPPALGRRTSSGWMPWNWQREAEGLPPPPPPPRQGDPLVYGREAGARRDQGRTSGFDLGDR